MNRKTLALMSLLVAGTVPLIPGAHARGGTEGKGGFVKVRQVSPGQVQIEELTFPLQPHPMESVAGYRLALQALANGPLDYAAQGKLLRAIRASGNRRYFAVQGVDPATTERLTADFLRAVADTVRPEDALLVAVTEGENTFLLPGFFQLDAAWQASSLLHEALWNMSGEWNYRLVVNAEIKFRAYLKRQAPALAAGKRLGYDEDFFPRLDYFLRDGSLSVKAALRDDFDRGRAPGLFINGQPQVMLRDLIGEFRQPGLDGHWVIPGDDSAAAKLAEQAARYPESLGLARLAAVLGTGRMTWRRLDSTAEYSAVAAQMAGFMNMSIYTLTSDRKPPCLDPVDSVPMVQLCFPAPAEGDELPSAPVVPAKSYPDVNVSPGARFVVGPEGLYISAQVGMPQALLRFPRAGCTLYLPDVSAAQNSRIRPGLTLTVDEAEKLGSGALVFYFESRGQIRDSRNSARRRLVCDDPQAANAHWLKDHLAPSLDVVPAFQDVAND
jgi:hypothetical protein